MVRKARLKDVAERAGVAVNTASTILNRRSNSWASKETEARVFQAAKDSDYLPFKTARALRSGRFHSIGFLIQDLTNPFFSTLADELEAVAEARGYDMLVENCRSSTVREKHLFAHINELKVDGIVTWLSDNEVFRDRLAKQFAKGLPMVALGNGIPEIPIPVDAVLSDFTQGLSDTVEALCSWATNASPSSVRWRTARRTARARTSSNKCWRRGASTPPTSISCGRGTRWKARAKHPAAFSRNGRTAAPPPLWP